MKIIRKAGDTSTILQIFIQDSSSTTGAGLTGLLFNSGSLTAYYHKDTDTTATAIALVTMTVGTFTSSGFKEIDSTNMPGWYQFCPPDAALSTSGSPKSVGIHLKGATNMAPLAIEIQLITFDLQLAALTAAAIATGVWTDTTAGDFTVGVSIGKSVMNGVALGTGLTINAYTGDTPQTGDSFGRIGALGAGLTGITNVTLAASQPGVTIPTVTTVTNQLTAAAVAAGVWRDAVAADFTQASSIGKSVMNGVALGTGLTINAYTGDTPQTGDSFARIGALGAGLTGITNVTLAASQPGVTIPTVTTVTNQLTAAQIATGVWTDTTAGDFTLAASIGKSVMNGVSLGTGLTSNMTQIAGNATAATALSNSTQSICWGTCSGGTTATAVVSSLNNPTSLTDSGQLIGRTIIFLGNTGTANVEAQASNITASSTGSTPTITFTAMTHAPAAGDTFVVI
jgi:uncharacterized membrane protein YuzA (DUF378 family)